MSPLISISLLAVYFSISLIACFRIIPILRARRIVDVGGERSSHKGEKLRGGGLGFVPILLLGVLAVLLLMDVGSFWWISLAVVIGFAALSFVDDLRDLSASRRFAAHLVFAGALCFTISSEFVPFQSFQLFPSGIQEVLTRAAMTVMFVWWINLFNFMDGIDGISIVQTSTITIGILLLLGVANSILDTPLGWIAALTTLSCIAFAFVNWHPARVFMGDVGSVGLGALTGVLLINVLSSGFESGFFLLPMYYFFDATSTLVYRIAKGHKFWKPHRLHSYQNYVDKGYPHDGACYLIMGLSVVLIILAINPIGWPTWTIVSLGAFLTVGLIAYFRLSSPYTGG